MDRDRNLLFGVFAVQLRKVSASDLMAAAAAWAADQSKELPARLLEARALSQRDVDFIQKLVNEAIDAHDGDVAATLQTLGGEAQVYASFGGSIILTNSGGLGTVKSPTEFTEALHYLDAGDVPGVQETPGRYTHVSEYGRGGMGRVLLVHDAFLGRDVALKELLPGPEPKDPNSPSTPVRKYMGFLSRFLQEARITGQLEHPSIVPVYELGHRKDGTLYYTMKLVRGKTLRQAIHECKSLRERLRLLSHFVNLCQAIAYAHSRGIIHRDLKPDNVMVGEFGETVVLDWGLAKAKDREDVHADGLAETIRLLQLGDVDSAAKTQYGQVMGTPAYMPPEQAKGQLELVDERSDVYSLGAVLYEILSDQSPFTGQHVHEILRRVIQEDPRPIGQLESDAPAELVAICGRAMQKDPGRRYSTTRELADEVQRFQSGALVQAHTYTNAQLIRRFLSRYRAVVMSGAAALLIFVIMTTTYLFNLTQANRELIIARDAEAAQRRQSELARENESKERERAESSAYISGIWQAYQHLKNGNLVHAKRQLLETPGRLRNWEWGNLYNALDSSIISLANHSDFLHDAAWSSDGRFIVTGSADSTAKLWDANSGTELATLAEHSDPVTCVAFSKDGARILTASLDQTVKVWDAQTAQVLMTIPVGNAFKALATFSGDGNQIVTASYLSVKCWDAMNGEELAEGNHGEPITILLYSPDGTRFVTGSEHSVKIWDAAGKELHKLLINSAIGDIAFSSDGNRILVCCQDTVPTIWDVTTGKMALSLSGHTDTVNSGAFSTDGARLVTASSDKSAKVWDGVTGKEILTLQGHVNAVTSAIFNSDDDQIVTASSDNIIRFWDTDSGSLLRTSHGHTKSILGMFGNNVNHRVLTFSWDTTAKVWDGAATGNFAVLKGDGDPIRSAKYSSDGTRALTHTDDGKMTVWDVQSSSQLTTLSEPVYLPSFSPDGTCVLGVSAKRETIKAFDSKSGREMFSFEENPEPSFIITSPTAEYVVAPIAANNVGVWSAETGELHAKLIGHKDVVVGATFSPDGKKVVTASEDLTARIWNIDTGASLLLLEHPEKVSDAVFSPDGKYVLTESSDRRVRLWDALGGVCKLTHVGFRPVFSPTGNRYLFLNQSATIWDIQSGEEVLTLSKEVEPIGLAAYSPDGTRILTSSYDHTKTWDAFTGRAITTLIREAVSSAAFSPDGEIILTTSWASGPKLWDASSGKQIKKLGVHENYAFDGTFSADGRLVLTVGGDNRSRIWDSSTGTELRTLNGTPAAFNRDGSRVFTAPYDYVAGIWDATTGERGFELRGHVDRLTNAVFDSRGDRIITASVDGTAKIWDANSGRELSTLSGHSGAVYDATFNFDGSRIATVSEDKSARIWDAKSYNHLLTLSDHFSSAVVTASFSPEGQRIVTTDINGRVKLWEVETGKDLAELGENLDNVAGVSFSPDGQQIVLSFNSGGDSAMKLYESSLGKELFTMFGHTGNILGAKFSPDSQRVISASVDKTARIWDTRSGKELATLIGHEEFVTASEFSEDGSTVITSSLDGTARIWSSVPWKPYDWKNDAERQLILDISSRQPPNVIHVVLEPNEMPQQMEALERAATLWKQSTNKDSAIIRDAKEQGVYIVEAPRNPIGKIVFEDEDLLTKINSNAKPTVGTFIGTLDEFMEERRSWPDQSATLELQIVNRYARRMYLVEFPGVISESISIKRKQFASYCRIQVQATKANRARAEDQGSSIDNFPLVDTVGYPPLLIKKGDQILESDGRRITGYDSDIERVERWIKGAEDGTLKQTQLKLRRGTTNQYITLTINLVDE